MKNKMIAGTLLYATTVFVCLTAVSCRGEQRQAMMPGMGGEYKVLEVSLSDKTLATSYSASIKGRQDVEIRPQVSGLITEIKVREGERVRKGQTLFIIDQVSYRAALETAKANVKAARADVETARLTAESKQELYAQEVVSLYDLQTARNSLLSAEAGLAQAEAQLANAENDLSYTVVKSPADGIVGTLPYRVGALVGSSVSTPLTTVSDNSEMYVYFSLTENQVLSLTREYGSMERVIESMPEVELRLSDGTAYGETGRVEAVSGVIDRTAGAVSVRAVFPNEDGILLSGGAGSVIYPYVLKDVMVIPQAATYELQDKIFVYKVIGGIAESTEIKVLPVNDGTAYVVESGISVGDTIVAEGAGLLRNGTPVTPASATMTTDVPLIGSGAAAVTDTPIPATTRTDIFVTAAGSDAATDMPASPAI